MAEYGIVVVQRDVALRQVLADLDAHPQVPTDLKELLRMLSEHWATVRAAMATCDGRIEAHARRDARFVRLRELIGVGPLTLYTTPVIYLLLDRFNSWLGRSGARPH